MKASHDNNIILNDKVLIIVPAYNEEQTIGDVVNDVLQNTHYDLLVIDDGSNDHTSEIIAACNCQVITHPKNLSYSKSLQDGYKYALENNYKYVVQMDADGQHLASQIKLLVETYESNDCNVVIGSRFKGNTGYKSSLLRRLGTQMMSNKIYKITGKKIYDPLSGFQLLDKTTLELLCSIKMPKFPDANLVLFLLKQGIKIEECPVKMLPRQGGVDMHSGILAPIKYYLYMQKEFKKLQKI